MKPKASNSRKPQPCFTKARQNHSSLMRSNSWSLWWRCAWNSGERAKSATTTGNGDSSDCDCDCGDESLFRCIRLTCPHPFCSNLPAQSSHIQPKLSQSWPPAGPEVSALSPGTPGIQRIGLGWSSADDSFAFLRWNWGLLGNLSRQTPRENRQRGRTALTPAQPQQLA